VAEPSVGSKGETHGGQEGFTPVCFMKMIINSVLNVNAFDVEKVYHKVINLLLFNILITFLNNCNFQLKSASFGHLHATDRPS